VLTTVLVIEYTLAAGGFSKVLWE